MNALQKANAAVMPEGVGIQPFSSAVVQPGSSPVVARVRAYFAPVNRTTGAPVFFDAGAAQPFNTGQPPSPWVDLGWTDDFARKSASVFSTLSSGFPATVQQQVRQELSATVSFRFLTWGKLQMALATGSEQMNLLAEAKGGSAMPTGGTAVAAVPAAAGSSATEIVVADATPFAQGDIVAVDVDYAGQTGYVGSGASAGYVATKAQSGCGVDYIRRLTLNVGRVVSVSGNTLTLDAPLLGGAPAAGTGVQAVTGFVDREGGLFFQEWSALFVAAGQQGETIFYHYPRLQTMHGASESAEMLTGNLASMLLNAQFRALPVNDPLDGAAVLCYRSYIPAGQMAI